MPRLFRRGFFLEVDLKKALFFLLSVLFLFGCINDSGDSSGTSLEDNIKENQNDTVLLSGKIVFPTDDRSSLMNKTYLGNIQTLKISENSDFILSQVVVEFLGENEAVPGLSLIKRISKKQYLFQIDISYFGYIDDTNTKAVTAEIIQKLNDLNENIKFYPRYLRKSLWDSVSPNDPYIVEQWALEMLNLGKVFGGGKNAHGVAVAVLDNGISHHDDLSLSSIIKGYDFVSDLNFSDDGDGIDPDPYNSSGFDIGWHGTAVAGILGAATNNSMGISAAAPGCDLFCVRVVGNAGADDYDIAQGILYAAGLSNDSKTLPAKKADIINLSVGGPGKPMAILEESIQRALSNGCIIVAAAGNSNSSEPIYPAACEGVISVAALNALKVKSKSSSYGTTIDVCAPGGDSAVGVLSLGYSGYLDYSGTSFASPHVAGVLAIGKNIYQGLLPADIDFLLKGTHPDLYGFQITQDLGQSGYDIYYGYGLLDAFKTVVAAEKLNMGDNIYISLFDFEKNIYKTVKTSKKESYLFEISNIEEGDYFMIAYTDRFDKGYPSNNSDIWGSNIYLDLKPQVISVKKGDHKTDITINMDNKADVADFFNLSDL